MGRVTAWGCRRPCDTPSIGHVNANLTISEIVTIVLVILVVFGPHRLPEMARKAGEMLAKVRQAASTVRDEFSREMEEIKEVAAPLTDLDAELKKAKADIQQSMPRMDDIPGAADVQRVINPVPDIAEEPSHSAPEVDPATVQALTDEAAAAEAAAAEARARAEAAAAALAADGGHPDPPADGEGGDLDEVGGAA